GAVHHAGGTGRRLVPRPAATQRRGTGRGATVDPGQRCPGVLLPAAQRPVLSQLNESPQAQDPVAFGLSIVKPCFSMVSTKSMVAPCTYGALIGSTVKVTPPNSAVRSPSSDRSSKNRL